MQSQDKIEIKVDEKKEEVKGEEKKEDTKKEDGKVTAPPPFKLNITPSTAT